MLNKQIKLTSMPILKTIFLFSISLRILRKSIFQSVNEFSLMSFNFFSFQSIFLFSFSNNLSNFFFLLLYLFCILFLLLFVEHWRFLFFILSSDIIFRKSSLSFLLSEFYELKSLFNLLFFYLLFSFYSFSLLFFISPSFLILSLLSN